MVDACQILHVSYLQFALLSCFSMFSNYLCELIIMIIETRNVTFFLFLCFFFKSLWIIQMLEINLFYVRYVFLHELELV